MYSFNDWYTRCFNKCGSPGWENRMIHIVYSGGGVWLFCIKGTDMFLVKLTLLIFSMNLPRERFWNTFESLVHRSIPCENLFYTGSIRVENSIWMNVKMLNKMNCMGLGWWARMVQYINIYIYAILWFEMGRMVFDWVCTY